MAEKHQKKQHETTFVQLLITCKNTMSKHAQYLIYTSTRM